MDPNFVWISHENTHILLRQTTVGQLKEWVPVGEVVLRQIYETLPPRWFACAYNEPHNDLLVRAETVEEAKTAVFERAGGR